MTLSARAPKPGRWLQLTVQGWLILILATMGVLTVVGAVAGGILMNRTDDVSRQLIDQIQPARSASYRLQVALRDQETAIRGYVISADRQFLAPYYDGLADEHAAADDFRQRVGERTKLVTGLDDIEKASAEWRAGYAEPLIASVRPGVPDLQNTSSVDRGKAEFDHIRTLSDAQNQDLIVARADAIAALDQVRTWRNRALIGLVAVFVGTAVLLAALTRPSVTRPLADLAAACRRITQGNFDEKISARGPKDIRQIAVDVENMRQRIVDELDTTRSARELLTEQAIEMDEQAVDLKRSNSELEQFAYVASHDLQEPLRKITSFCQLLERRYADKLDERGVEYIAFAVDGAKRMQVLINDLLTFSRVGRLHAEHDEVDLDTTLADATANLSIAIEEAGADVVLPTSPLPHVVGDPTLLTMLWQNMIGNAVKFHRDGETPRIVIDCEAGTGDHEGQWSFTVSDNGIGIAPEFVDKVFVIFQRLHGRDEYSGTGIGLALCKKIVEYHGGSIGIDTSYHDGTRISFTLPVTKTSDAALRQNTQIVSEGTPQ
jgi:signal transduction histidine kinase